MEDKTGLEILIDKYNSMMEVARMPYRAKLEILRGKPDDRGVVFDQILITVNNKVIVDQHWTFNINMADRDIHFEQKCDEVVSILFFHGISSIFFNKNQKATV